MASPMEQPPLINGEFFPVVGGIIDGSSMAIIILTVNDEQIINHSRLFRCNNIIYRYLFDENQRKWIFDSANGIS